MLLLLLLLLLLYVILSYKIKIIIIIIIIIIFQRKSTNLISSNQTLSDPSKDTTTLTAKTEISDLTSPS